MSRGIDAEPGERRPITHPQGKKGVRISRQKYDVLSVGIGRSLRRTGAARLAATRQEVEEYLQGKLEGCTSWYLTTAKPSLEARGILGRAPEIRPQHIGLREDPSERREM